MNAEQQSKQWSQIVARTWTDTDFKKRLLAEPATVLREKGIAVPAGITIRVVQDTASVRHLTLPLKPAGDLTEAQLEDVAGGRAPSVYLM